MIEFHFSIITHLNTCLLHVVRFPDAGHLVHMPTHIDVLIGDYDSCVRYNHLAIAADEKLIRISPDTADTESFYFGYIVHNFHMLVYGAILGGMESIAMNTAHRLNAYLNEDLFVQNPDLTAYLEAYSALGNLIDCTTILIHFFISSLTLVAHNNL